VSATSVAGAELIWILLLAVLTAYVKRMENTSAIDPLDYSIAIKNSGQSVKPWRWFIHVAGKSKPLRQSESYATMSEATRAGKAALAELRANLAA
jgi:hypothetical protein